MLAVRRPAHEETRGATNDRSKCTEEPNGILIAAHLEQSSPRIGPEGECIQEMDQFHAVMPAVEGRPIIGKHALKVIAVTFFHQKVWFDGPAMAPRGVAPRDHIIHDQVTPGPLRPWGFVADAAGIGPGVPAPRDMDRPVVRMTRRRPIVVDRIHPLKHFLPTSLTVRTSGCRPRNLIVGAGAQLSCLPSWTPGGEERRSDVAACAGGHEPYVPKLPSLPRRSVRIDPIVHGYHR